jgi:hypothetical protein
MRKKGVGKRKKKFHEEKGEREGKVSSEEKRELKRLGRKWAKEREEDREKEGGSGRNRARKDGSLTPHPGKGAREGASLKLRSGKSAGEGGSLIVYLSKGAGEGTRPTFSLNLGGSRRSKECGGDRREHREEGDCYDRKLSVVT